ncbi:MAG: NUDIX hydrolase [Microbacteriaceae bacterium]|nr:NUDIX hydrolase [Microbacteriaceae bacterium]
MTQTPKDRSPEGWSADNPVPPPLPPGHLRDPGDAWVYSASGNKYWGAFGAAGLLVWHRQHGILLQHRAQWSHNGGTWGIPGGARRQGESAVVGALREAHEEAGVPEERVTVLHEFVVTIPVVEGEWTYTTVIVEAHDHFEPSMNDGESLALAWVAVDDVDARELHPGFAASWPALREILASHSR